ncbi:hypothetical protein ACH5RR_040156 [Cinchona calisaya]|uniref:KIB1-4 beta-propeller domain-containing protein n=1 Tax=Cinchona calisaya TaxID=153742 RepID=A0ABD2XTF9_9GENT
MVNYRIGIILDLGRSIILILNQIMKTTDCQLIPCLPFKFDGLEKNLRKQCNSKKYLVVDDLSGDLLMVIKHYANHVGDDDVIIFNEDNQGVIPYKTLRFDIYKLNVKEKSVEYVDRLNDRVIFLGLNQSFGLSARDFKGLKQNSVYFLDDFS